MPASQADPSPLQTAVDHHAAGRLAEAEVLYRQVLAAQPDQADALHLLGILLSALKRHEEGSRLVSRAVEARPEVPEYRNGLGNVLLAAGRIDEAEDAFKEAIRLRPDYADPLSNLGNVYKVQGRIDEALAVHAQAVALAPESPDAWNNYGVALRVGGRLDESQSAFERVIALRPHSAEAYNNLGTVLRNGDQLEASNAAYEKAKALRPDLAEVWTNWGNVQRDLGNLDEAIAGHAQAIRLRPEHANSYSNLAVALTSAGRLDDAVKALRRALELKPDAADLHSNLIYTLQFLSSSTGQSLLEEHRTWAARHAEPLTALGAKIDRPRNARVRIGFVSPDLRLHPVGRFLLPLLRLMDRNDVEVFCYCDVRRPDDFTAQLQMHTDRWRNIVGRSDDQVAQTIRGDQIDVLFDLSMHMADNRLLVFARRPAPVQITWLAYAGTTGMSAMDYRVSDFFLDPAGAALPYVEKTLRLPHCFWCYDEPIGAPEVSSAPALKAGYITFGCFNNFAKVTEPTLRLWSEVLASMPQSRLILHALEGSHRDTVRNLFASAGVSADRLDFVGFQPMEAFFAQHQEIDICLDPFPYGGGTTTCDALWMGVPVVTLAGKRAVGRGGVSILNHLGLFNLVAETESDYLRIAQSTATDLSGLAHLRRTLRERMRASILMNAQQFATEMTALCRHVVI